MKRSAVAMASLLCLLLTNFPIPSTADETNDQQVFTWVPAFQPNSDSADKLVMIVMTNDDSFVVGDADQAQALWCTPIVESVFRSVLRSRPELKDRCVLQSVAAGTPTLLTGGADRNQPDRAIIAVCDAQYRLLCLQVGVPNAKDMLRLIEDAQFMNILRQQYQGDDQKSKRFDEIVQYNSKRMPRLWREALTAVIATVQQDAEEDNLDLSNTDAARLRKRTLARIGESLEEIYLTDVKQRFAFNETGDLVRLAVIEQHPQTRQPWCDALLPFVVGSDFRSDWRLIAELVWKRTPVIDQPADEQLLQWWDGIIKSNMIILAIDPPLLASLRRWPPINVDNAADSRGLGWIDLENLAIKKPFRHVSDQQLASLMRARELGTIDTQLPSRARYVIFEPNRRQGITVHENELPAKHIGRLKRSIAK